MTDATDGPAPDRPLHPGAGAQRLRRCHRSAPAGYAFRDLVLRELPRPVRGGAEAGTGLGWAPRLTADVPGTLQGVPAEPLRQQRPRGVFQYRSCETDVLGWVAEAATGMRFPGLVGELVSSRIGAEFDADIGIDAEGTGLFDGGISATLGDLARFGLMIMDGGTSLTGGRWSPSGGWPTRSPADPTRRMRSPPVRTTTGCPAAVTATSSGCRIRTGRCCSASASMARWSSSFRREGWWRSRCPSGRRRRTRAALRKSQSLPRHAGNTTPALVERSDFRLRR